MSKTVQARLDAETEVLLRRLHRETGLGESELVRKAIRALASMPTAGGAPAILGVGKFSSGHRDLGSNKRRLRGFGKR